MMHEFTSQCMNTFRPPNVEQGKDGETSTHEDGTSLDILYLVPAVTDNEINRLKLLERIY